MSQDDLILTASQDEELARLIVESGVAFDPSTIILENDFHLERVESYNESIDQKPQMTLHQHQQLLEQQYAFPLVQNNIQVPRPIPTREHYMGQLQFKVHLDATDSKSYSYSERLKKVFILMETTLPVKFSWLSVPFEYNQLWVRATMVYKLDQHRSSPVHRCLNHRVPENNSNINIPEDRRMFVMRCDSNPASIYDQQPTNHHLSILTPLEQPQVGIDYVTVDYKFYCKNSCSSGMNRRPTEIIFTLETGEEGQVIGRQSLEVRICSCPKRDREKEEGELDKSSNGCKKRKLQPAKIPPGKKIMPDTKVYEVKFNVVGRENYQKVLNYGFDTMSGSSTKSGNTELYRPYLEELLRLMNTQP